MVENILNVEFGSSTESLLDQLETFLHLEVNFESSEEGFSGVRVEVVECADVSVNVQGLAVVQLR